MPVNTETLFEVIFQRLLDERKDFLGAVDGTVMFVIPGNGGGVWSLDLRKKGTGKVYPGRSDNPTLTIMIASDYLETFLAGKVDAEWAVEHNKLGIIGDKKKINAFATALGGGKQVGLRAALQ